MNKYIYKVEGGESHPHYWFTPSIYKYLVVNETKNNYIVKQYGQEVKLKKRNIFTSEKAALEAIEIMTKNYLYAMQDQILRATKSLSREGIQFVEVGAEKVVAPLLKL